MILKLHFLVSEYQSVTFFFIVKNNDNYLRINTLCRACRKTFDIKIKPLLPLLLIYLIINNIYIFLYIFTIFLCNKQSLWKL